MPNCGMGIIPPTIEEQAEKDNEQRRRIQCVGGCGVSNLQACVEGVRDGYDMSS